MYRRALAILPLLALFVALLGCGGGDPDLVAVVGRNLEIHLKPPVIVEKVALTDFQGRSRVIRPRASNRQLAVVDVALINRTSTFFNLLVDTDAAQIGDRRGERINALDPFGEQARAVETPGLDENLYAPFLWGELEIPRGFQISGSMVFDVPKGLRLGSLWWNEVDIIVLDYVEYRRP